MRFESAAVAARHTGAKIFGRFESQRRWTDEVNSEGNDKISIKTVGMRTHKHTFWIVCAYKIGVRLALSPRPTVNACTHALSTHIVVVRQLLFYFLVANYFSLLLFS